MKQSMSQAEMDKEIKSLEKRNDELEKYVEILTAKLEEYVSRVGFAEGKLAAVHAASKNDYSENYSKYLSKTNKLYDTFKEKKLKN